MPIWKKFHDMVSSKTKQNRTKQKKKAEQNKKEKRGQMTYILNLIGRLISPLSAEHHLNAWAKYCGIDKVPIDTMKNSTDDKWMGLGKIDCQWSFLLRDENTRDSILKSDFLHYFSFLIRGGLQEKDLSPTDFINNLNKLFIVSGKEFNFDMSTKSNEKLFRFGFTQANFPFADNGESLTTQLTTSSRNVSTAQPAYSVVLAMPNLADLEVLKAVSEFPPSEKKQALRDSPYGLTVDVLFLYIIMQYVMREFAVFNILCFAWLALHFMAMQNSELAILYILSAIIFAAWSYLVYRELLMLPENKIEKPKSFGDQFKDLKREADSYIRNNIIDYWSIPRSIRSRLWSFLLWAMLLVPKIMWISRPEENKFARLLWRWGIRWVILLVTTIVFPVLFPLKWLWYVLLWKCQMHPVVNFGARVWKHCSSGDKFNCFFNIFNILAFVLVAVHTSRILLSKGISYSDFSPTTTILSVFASFSLMTGYISYLRAFEGFNVLVSVLLNNVGDMWRFLLIILVLLVGFASIFSVLVHSFRFECRNAGADACIDINSTTRAFRSFAEALLKTFDYGIMAGYDSSEYNSAGASVLWLCWVAHVLLCILMPVVALNTLIAILGDSFDRVQDSSTYEKRLAKLNMAIEYLGALSTKRRREVTESSRYFLKVVFVDDIKYVDDNKECVTVQFNDDSDEWQGRIKTIINKVNIIEDKLAKMEKSQEDTFAKMEKSQEEMKMSQDKILSFLENMSLN